MKVAIHHPLGSAVFASGNVRRNLVETKGLKCVGHFQPKRREMVLLEIRAEIRSAIVLNNHLVFEFWRILLVELYAGAQHKMSSESVSELKLLFPHACKNRPDERLIFL